MAKGQKRSNREVRKPKKEKPPATAPAPAGFQVKQATNGKGPGGGVKK